MLNGDERENLLYITRSFNNSSGIASEIRNLNLFRNVIDCNSPNNALLSAALRRPKNIYIDSDVGLRPFIHFLAAKLISLKTDIIIYEEGLGTYREDLINSKIKKLLYRLIGAGTFYGDCFFTEQIYLFNPKIYTNKFPLNSRKIAKLPCHLAEWIQKNQTTLRNIFCTEFNISNVEKLRNATLYLPNWNVKLDEINEINRNYPLYIKPHPHTDQVIINQLITKIDKENISIVPGCIPAELLIMMMMEKFDTITIFHKNSSCINYLQKYIANKKIVPIEIQRS